MNKKLLLLLAALSLIVGIKLESLLQGNDIGKSAVMIGNAAMNHGGTGIILNSNKSETNVLTNDHVCKVVKKGGIVRSKVGDYQVVSVIESKVSDLCLLQVAGNLGVETKVSGKRPKMYDSLSVSGHPALMPNIISTGHLSGRAIIQVMTGTRPCTTDELSDPNLGLVCLVFGGLPVVKSYESVLVSATIMPGSSGSGVYNSSNNLIGVVFAGSSGFGYGWTVPYEQVLNFLNKEAPNAQKEFINQEISMTDKEDDSKKLKDVLEECSKATNETLLQYCNILKRDAIWVE